MKRRCSLTCSSFSSLSTSISEHLLFILHSTYTPLFRCKLLKHAKGPHTLTTKVVFVYFDIFVFEGRVVKASVQRPTETYCMPDIQYVSRLSACWQHDIQYVSVGSLYAADTQTDASRRGLVRSTAAQRFSSQHRAWHCRHADKR
jgi:hypothetical protein